MALPLSPPLKPQLAKSRAELPEGEQWRYEPKWDGFRTIVFRDGDEVHLQSRNGKPMNRYFPEVVEQVRTLSAPRVVLDGEMVVVVDDIQEFDLLSQRIHPAASRVEMLAREYPAALVAFDLLAEGDETLLELPYDERRERLAGLVDGAVSSPRWPPTSTDAGQVARGQLRGRGGQGGRRPLPAGRAQGDGEDQARAHGRRGGGRLPLRQGGGHRGLAHPGPLRRGRGPARGGAHLRLQGGREARAGGPARALPHPRAGDRRAEPLEVGRGARVGGTPARARVRDRLRPHHRAADPARREVRALAQG